MRCLPSCRCQELKATEKSFSLANKCTCYSSRFSISLYIIINPWKLGKPKIYGFDALVSRVTINSKRN